MPNYFSSTNCRASGNAMVYGPVLGLPAYFLWGELALNGHVVDSFSHVPGEPQPLSLPLQARFDSTYFGDGGTIVVSLEALDNFGRLYSASNSAPLKNKAKLFQLESLNTPPKRDSIPGVQGAFNAIDYSTVVYSDMSWHEPEIEDELEDCVAFFVATHGAQLTHQLGNEIDSILADTYLSFRQSINGTGLPPFNSTGSPPITLMHILACCCGHPSPVLPVENRFAQVMYPYDTAYNEGTANQALIAYDGEVYLDEYAKLSSRFTNDATLETMTINEARDATLRENALQKDIHIKPIGGPYQIMDVREEMRLWGDFDTRIKWLYTGTEDEAVNLWYG